MKLALNQNKGRETCRVCLIACISHILMTICWEELYSKGIWDLPFTGNCFVPEKILDNSNLTHWSARKGWTYWVFSEISTNDFPLSFFSTRKRLLKNSSWAVSAFLIAPFSSSYDICSCTSNDWCSYIFIVLGKFS